MVVCKYFLQGTCKFGNRCYNEHIQNSNYPIFRQGSGRAIQILAAPKGAPRGGRGMGNPHANGEFQGESAPEYYGRIEQQRYHRSHPPLGGPPSVYVASRYQSNGGLNRTSERKTSVRSNGYSKRNGFTEDLNGTELPEGGDFMNSSQLELVTQGSDYPSSEGSFNEGDGDNIHELREQSPDYTPERRRTHTSNRRATSTLKKTSSVKSDDSSSENSTQKENKEFNTADPDELFFRSLVPQMKKLDDQQKSFVKIEISKLIYQALFPGETCN